MKETIIVTIQPVETGFFVDSQDLPQMNLFVREAAKLVEAIPEAIKYLYKHNRGMDVRVLLEVPLLGQAETPQREVEITRLPLAA